MTLFNDLYNIFLRPIVEAAEKILKPVTDAIDKYRVVAESETADKEYKAKKAEIWKSFHTKSPMTSEDAATQTREYMDVMEPQLSAQIISLIGIETATLGQVDISLQGLTQMPYFQDDMQNLTMAHRAEFVEGVYPALRRYQLKRFTPMIPEAYRLALAASKGIIGLDKYLVAMAESGLDSEWADVWQEQNYVYPNLSQLAELYWRGVITDETFTWMMQRNGFRSDSIEYLKALRELIPPAGDLVTMVVREAFDPKYVVTAPAVFAEYMAKKGFTGTWADRYWTAHFVPMAVTQAYDNLRRGYWDKDQFLEFLRIADIHPQWREDIYNVAFNPPTVREMGYGYDVGVYNIEDIVKYRRWGGLSREDAEKAAVSMVAYRTEAERNSVRTEYMYLFGRGKLTLAEFERYLIELGTPAPATALWVERAQAYKIRITTEPTPEEPPSMTRSIAQWMYERGVRPVSWLRSTLASLGYTAETIDDFVAQSNFKIADAKTKEIGEIDRNLTLAQIRNLFKLGYIEYANLPSALVKLGYSRTNAKLLSELMIYDVAGTFEEKELTRADIVRLYEYKLLDIGKTAIYTLLQNIITIEGVNSPTRALFQSFENLGYESTNAAYLAVWTAIEVALPTLKARYSKGWITATQMYNAIREIGLPDDKANELMETIVKAESSQRTLAEKDLTKAEIVKGAKQGILSVTQASELLQGLGYDENEAIYILYINAVVERGDPEGYWEMRKVVEAQKKARGEKSVDIPDDLILLEFRIKDAKAMLEKLKAEKATEEAIGAQAVSLGQLETNMRIVIAKLRL
jgi:hypothetical protein